MRSRPMSAKLPPAPLRSRPATAVGARRGGGGRPSLGGSPLLRPQSAMAALGASGGRRRPAGDHRPASASPVVHLATAAPVSSSQRLRWVCSSPRVGRIDLDMILRAGGDSGVPGVGSTPADAAAAALEEKQKDALAKRKKQRKKIQKKAKAKMGGGDMDTVEEAGLRAKTNRRLEKRRIALEKRIAPCRHAFCRPGWRQATREHVVMSPRTVQEAGLVDDGLQARQKNMPLSPTTAA